MILSTVGKNQFAIHLEFKEYIFKFIASEAKVINFFRHKYQFLALIHIYTVGNQSTLLILGHY
jgi:hypothetical protein